MSDSNVGGRKGRSIRNHCFMVNSIIFETVAQKADPIDIAIFDFKKCFDILPPTVVCNDLYELGIKNDLLNLIHESDRISHVAVKTPLGLTERKSVTNCVTQGDTMATLKCVCSVDNMNQKHTKNLSGELYKYKNRVKIPPLGMVDDELVISKCGHKSALATEHHNTQSNLKKLQFGQDKCVKVHVGRQTKVCTENIIDTWSVEGINGEVVTSILDLIDVESNPHSMELEDSWKYLGDILSSDGKNDLNIRDKVGKGLGAVTQIIQMLADLVLGPYYYEAAIILRSALLLSTILSNSETWVNLSMKNVEDLEKVDEEYLRQLLGAPAKTPIELLYLELGVVPIRFLLMARRINYLKYLLCDNEDSLLSHFFKAQCEDPVKGDWVSQVKADLKHLELNLTFDEIEVMSKEVLKKVVKEKISSKALCYLKELQQKHSKSQPLQYEKLCLQDYLQSDIKSTQREKSFAFNLRSRMIELKANFKSVQKNLTCRLCGAHEENQPGLLICQTLNANTDISTGSPPQFSDLYSHDKNKIKLMPQVSTSYRGTRSTPPPSWS